MLAYFHVLIFDYGLKLRARLSPCGEPMRGHYSARGQIGTVPVRATLAWPT